MMKTTTQNRIVIRHEEKNEVTKIGRFIYSVQYHPLASRDYIIRAEVNHPNNWEFLEPLLSEVVKESNARYYKRLKAV